MKKRFYQIGKQVLSLTVLITGTLLFSNQVFSQGVSINGTGTGTAPDGSAILDLNVSSITPKKGFLAPRMTEAQRDAIGTPATGLLIYQTDGAAGFYYYPAGGPWTPISSTSGTITGTGTTNHHAKWTSGTTLGDGLFFDNGTTVSINTNSTNASAVVDLNVTNQGILLPRVALNSTSVADVLNPIATPATSLLIYNTATVNDVKEGFYYRKGANWVEIASNLPAPSTGDGGYLAWDNSLQTYVLSPMSFTGTVSTVSGEMVITGKIVQSSDNRFKKDIKPIDEALSKVMQMNGVTYNWKKEEFPTKNFPDGRSYGVIAQEIEKVVPELVKTGDDGYKSVEYSNMAALFIEAIKEQQAIIDAQKSDITVLKASLETEKILRNEQLNTLILRISTLENNVENTTNKAQK